MKAATGTSAAIAGLATSLMGTAGLAAPGGHCTSVQARCAVEIGGLCDPKTGHWQFGAVSGGYRVGGNTEAFDACVSRTLASRKGAAATASCRTMGFQFHPAQNDTISTTGVSDGGSACTHRFRSLSTLALKSASIASPPSNGSLSEVGAMAFRYRPNVRFKGVDHYAVRICGTGVGGSGCSTITYAITVR
jgi:hypothetical protein